MVFVRARGVGDHVKEDARKQLDTFQRGFTGKYEDQRARTNRTMPVPSEGESSRLRLQLRPIIGVLL
jgi:hypothetical protein